MSVRKNLSIPSETIEPKPEIEGNNGMPLDSQEDERRLISLAQAGDREAFCALARTHVPGLLRAAATLGCEQNAAEDLAQETLWEAWRSLRQFDGRCRLSTWLFGILRHRWLKLLRKKLPQQLDEASAQAMLASPGQAPEADLESQEQAAHLRQALTCLPDAQREVLELRFFAQASLEEIAVALSCPLGTVKSRLHHGLEKLRQLKFD